MISHRPGGTIHRDGHLALIKFFSTNKRKASRCWPGNNLNDLTKARYSGEGLGTA